MKKDFIAENWKEYLPQPICGAYPAYKELYEKTWELARAHVRDVKGMPQTPYMDEAFCDTQVWIWDSCFMSLFCKFAQEVFPGIETLQNFYEVLYAGKSLPTVLPTRQEPSWTGAVYGKPYAIKVHIADNPPLFAWAEYENALIHGNKNYVQDLLYKKQVLQKHYEWIETLTETAHLPNVLLETYLKREEKGYKWEGGASGMDNTPRGRTAEYNDERPNNPNMLWIDAICQQALSANVISRLFAIVGDEANQAKWEKRFIEKKECINRFYWDETDRFYYDVDCIDGRFYKVQTIASYWALTAGVASKEQARAMADMVLSPSKFGGSVPLVSLARDDVDFDATGRYWRGGLWLPTAYAALKGLANYGLYDEAHTCAQKILSHMLTTYQEYEPHTVWECYSPQMAKPGMQTDNVTLVRPDFCGWSALGPISIYIEFVLGFHTINAFEKVVKWWKPSDICGKIGVCGLRFGEVLTDIIADEWECYVKSNVEYTLEINGKLFKVLKGENVFTI